MNLNTVLICCGTSGAIAAQNMPGLGITLISAAWLIMGISVGVIVFARGR